MTANTLHNKRIIVTGGNSGIGLDALRVFCAQGAHVIMASRDDTRAQAAVAAVQQAQPDSTANSKNTASTPRVFWCIPGSRKPTCLTNLPPVRSNVACFKRWNGSSNPHKMVYFNNKKGVV
jgi:NAD(P)-dependent dehydrogenase (short-subunit alcohol dehydrogenase family)